MQILVLREIVIRDIGSEIGTYEIMFLRKLGNSNFGTCKFVTYEMSKAKPGPTLVFTYLMCYIYEDAFVVFIRGVLGYPVGVQKS